MIYPFYLILNYKIEVFYTKNEWALRSFIHFCINTSSLFNYQFNYSLLFPWKFCEILGFTKENTPERLCSINDTWSFCSVCLYLMVLNFMQIKTFIDCIALKFYWLKEVYPKLLTVKLTDHWFQWFYCDVSFPFQRFMRYH